MVSKGTKVLLALACAAWLFIAFGQAPSTTIDTQNSDGRIAALDAVSEGLQGLAATELRERKGVPPTPISDLSPPPPPLLPRPRPPPPPPTKRNTANQSGEIIRPNSRLPPANGGGEQPEEDDIEVPPPAEEVWFEKNELERYLKEIVRKPARA